MRSRRQNDDSWEAVMIRIYEHDYSKDATSSTQEANAMKSCGRSDPSHTFKDFRSPSVPHKRALKRKQKYFNLANVNVNSNQIGQPHYENPNSKGPWSCSFWPANLAESPVVHLTKKQLYEEISCISFRRNTPYCHCYNKSCCKYPKTQLKRLHAEPKREGRDWNKNGYHSDFPHRSSWDTHPDDWYRYDILAAKDVQREWIVEEYAWRQNEDFDGENMADCRFCWYCCIPCPFTAVLEEPEDDGRLDLHTLVDDAVDRQKERVGREMEWLGWTEVESECMASPELEYASDGELESEEGFEMI